jgi:hypothetical protein
VLNLYERRENMSECGCGAEKKKKVVKKVVKKKAK